MREFLSVNDKTQVCDTVKDLQLFKVVLEIFKRIMVSQGHQMELDSVLALHELFHRLPDWLKQSYENNCCITVNYIPRYDSLIACVNDALQKKRLSAFGN